MILLKQKWLSSRQDTNCLAIAAASCVSVNPFWEGRKRGRLLSQGTVEEVPFGDKRSLQYGCKHSIPKLIFSPFPCYLTKNACLNWVPKVIKGLWRKPPFLNRSFCCPFFLCSVDLTFVYTGSYLVYVPCRIILDKDFFHVLGFCLKEQENSSLILALLENLKSSYSRLKHLVSKSPLVLFSHLLQNITCLFISPHAKIFPFFNCKELDFSTTITLFALVQVDLFQQVVEIKWIARWLVKGQK